MWFYRYYTTPSTGYIEAYHLCLPCDHHKRDTAARVLTTRISPCTVGALQARPRRQPERAAPERRGIRRDPPCKALQDILPISDVRSLQAIPLVMITRHTGRLYV